MTFRDYAYRGRHRQSRSHSRSVGLGATAAAALSLSPVVVPGVAAADPLDAIARCESGGNPRASNGTHFGLYQFDLGTWRSVGGTGHPLNASASAQHAAAARLLASRGTQPWNASRHCWAGQATPRRAVVATTPKRAPKVHPHRDAVRRVVSTAGSAVPDGYRVVSGDTLGKLATRYRTSVRAIAAANGVAHPDRIYVGQRLR